LVRDFFPAPNTFSLSLKPNVQVQKLFAILQQIIPMLIICLSIKAINDRPMTKSPK